MSLPSVSGSNMENVSPQVIRRVTKEVLELAESPPEGIKVFVNEEDITDIQATITGPAGTPYEGGVFRMKLVLSRDFPASPPQGFFLTKIFHPNVAKNGAICVNTLKKDWKPDHGIKHILLTVKCLLIYPNPDSALNEEAGKLLQERYDDYSSHARMMTEIHARPPKSSSSCSSTTASSFSHTSSSRTSPKELRCFAVAEGGSETTCESTSTSGGNGATSQGKKRPLSDKSLGSTVNGAEKKKKDKKKALKRL